MTSFATAPRGGLNAFRYAEACLKQGMSYQGASMAAGVNTDDLKARHPGYEISRSAPNVSPSTAFVRCAAILPGATEKDLKQTLALTLSLLADQVGFEGAKTAAEHSLGLLPHPRERTFQAVGPIPAYGVARSIAAHYFIPWEGFTSARRTRAYARPRQIAMYAIRELCPNRSYPDIGRILGDRDHTTILHGVRKVEELIQTDAEFAAEVAQVMAMVRQRFGKAS